jgi:hypothetical protein
MAEQDRRRTDSRLRQFWHDWMPIITFCASALGCFGGGVWGVSSYKNHIDTSLNTLEIGQKNIETEHHMLSVKLDREDEKINKVMFRLRIPIDDISPEYHTWPQDNRKGPDATLDKDLENIYKNDKHSRVAPPDPVLGLMHVPPDPQITTTQRNTW